MYKKPVDTVIENDLYQALDNRFHIGMKGETAFRIIYNTLIVHHYHLGKTREALIGTVFYLTLKITQGNAPAQREIAKCVGRSRGTIQRHITNITNLIEEKGIHDVDDEQVAKGIRNYIAKEEESHG